MKKSIVGYLLFIFFHLFLIESFAQTTKLKPGFDRDEFLELLKVSSRQGDSLYNPDLPAPDKFQKIYRSSEMGLVNRWDLWVNEDRVACISIRGSILKQVSWLDNFYAAMVPASGSLKLSNDFVFDYHLSDDHRAAVHAGWLIATAFLSRDILPKIDSLYHSGYHDFYIMGHSQGGAISYLLTALLLKKQQSGGIPAEIRFKTYSSAAPKPGNLYFAYDYENMVKGGWALTVINAADWVPQAPVSIQTIKDFVEVNPFTNAREVIRKQPFLKRVVMTKVYNSLDKPSDKAEKKFQKYLGKDLEGYIRRVLPEFESPQYANSNNYVRTGQQIVLYPNEEYFTLFPQDNSSIWINHLFESYLFLTSAYPTIPKS
jgi:hypothetical protein